MFKLNAIVNVVQLVWYACLQILNIAYRLQPIPTKTSTAAGSVQQRLLSLLASGTAVAWKWTLLELKLGLLIYPGLTAL